MERACLAIVLLASSALAQLDTNPVSHLKLRLKFTGGGCDPTAHVQLMGTSGPLLDGRPNEQCEVDFANLPSGTYHVEISGQGFSQTDEFITTTNLSTDLEVEIKGGNDPMTAAPAGPTVSAADLSVPAKALKAFDKSNALINRQDFPNAIQSLNRAIAIYPSYAAAYNNLGAIYARLGDRDKEREALEKAIRLDSHLAAAYLNLGRMHIAAKDFPAAEAALQQAVANNPTDPIGLVLLSYCQFEDHHLDDAIASSHRAHALKGGHASVHLIAAKSFEQKHDAPGAIAELEVFLKEEPTGERADQARKDLQILYAIHE
jgi:tetratricopeptide (TPR) repeat protein